MNAKSSIGLLANYTHHTNRPVLTHGKTIMQEELFHRPLPPAPSPPPSLPLHTGIAFRQKLLVRQVGYKKKAVIVKSQQTRAKSTAKN